MPSKTRAAAPKLSARRILANNVLTLRTGKGLSQEDLAFEAGLHRTFIAHVERGARNISVDNIEKIASALDAEVWLLLKQQDPFNSSHN